MSSLTNINNNASVVNVGRTTPVTPGVKPSSQSIPVVIATDQPAIPVIEQQKIQSEVALSLLGIPRGEVALGIFSDVNTYDVNPTEWSASPAKYTDGYGVKHRPSEAGALIQAGKDNIAVLSSKRFFRYQPGRVSAVSFGIKSSVSPTPASTEIGASESETYDRNPAIRKFGVLDKYDGYYWESRGDGKGDNFVAIRRTQSLIKYNPLPFTNQVGGQIKDYRIVGKQADNPSDEPNAEPNAIQVVLNNRFDIIDAAYDAAVTYFSPGQPGANPVSLAHLQSFEDKCKRDASFAIDAYILDLQYGGAGHTVTNATTYRTALLGSGDAQKQAAEVQLHTQLRATLKTYLSGFVNLNSVARNTRIDTLTQYTISAVGGTQPSSGVLTGTNRGIWTRNKILTVFAIYKRYLGYLVSESFVQANYTDDIKYKCYRDIGYVVDGYARDLAFGGNSATVYNMKNFYFNDIRQVVTNFGTGNSVVAFHQRAHTLLKQLISKATNVTTADDPDTTGTSTWDLTRAILKGASASGFTSVFTLFNLASSIAAGSTKTVKAKFDEDLFTPLYSNFTTEYTGLMEYGAGAQYGDLITIRDGLMHIHAAVYDPSLLKKVAPIRVKVDPSTNTIEASTGEFVINQFITFTGDAGGLVSGKIYGIASVSGPRNNTLKLYDPAVGNDIHETKIEVDITSAGTDNFIEIGTPFIFPRHYFKGPQPSAPQNNYTRYDGMFPYMYAKPDGTVDGNLGDLTAADPNPNSGTYNNDFINRVGYINTSYDLSAGTSNLKREVDYVNLIYNNWIKQNVDPKYYAVYEYRVPRSRFSADKLDAVANRSVVYSDVAFGEIEDGNVTTCRPGLNVINNGKQLTSTSVWNLDFQNVSMLKIEYSWYGAVGAMFLAYVPVGNGEARWVRVHHMRASNQLKVASMGNATLPITYLTYGGGSIDKLGLVDTLDKGYDSTSNHIVKYGASYYIDGGDRGTVRLYSHTNNTNTKAYGKIYNVGTVTTIANTDFGGTYLTIPAGVGPTDKTFFMKGQVVTSSVQDQNVSVEWVDGNKIYINKSDLISKNGVKIIAERPSVAFGLKAKQSLLNSVGFGVRNRVQVYPTKLATANFGSLPIKLNVVKTPLFQPNIPTFGTFVLDSSYEITSDNLPLPTSSVDYLRRDEDYVYGWFRSNVGTVFGRLYRDNGGQYYFELRDVFSTAVVLYSGAGFAFLKDGRFDFEGNTIFAGNTTAVGVVSDSSIEKERLSSVFINNTIQTPVPQSGTINASFFLKPGSDQFDLSSYFDYNKDYLSYPLTNEISSIYLMASSISEGNTTPAAEINVGMTWEEQ